MSPMIARTWVGGWALLALGAGALACRSGDLPATTAPPTKPSAGPERCLDLSGSYRFESLAASCHRKGSLSQLPLYPIESGGRLRGPRDRGDFLPLPLAHWADADSVVTLRQERCSRLTLRLADVAVDLPAGELRQHGRLEWDGGGMWSCPDFVDTIPLP